jgi:hypothetical protein
LISRVEQILLVISLKNSSLFITVPFVCNAGWRGQAHDYHIR